MGNKMDKVLFTGFKGKHNSSGLLAERLSPAHILITNSFAGLKKDIDSIKEDYDYVVMFGVDKTLTSEVRIERKASRDGRELSSSLDLEKFREAISAKGIEAVISDKPSAYLCNEAYWHVLDKFSGRAVFIHIPTVKHADEIFMDKMKAALQQSVLTGFLWRR